mgnify:CR=1 FL=1
MLFKLDSFYFLQQVAVAVRHTTTATATSVCILVKGSFPSKRLLFETTRSNKNSHLITYFWLYGCMAAIYPYTLTYTLVLGFKL